MIEKPKPREIQARIESYSDSEQKNLLLQFSEYLAKLDIEDWGEVDEDDLPENSAFQRVVERKFNFKKKRKEMTEDISLEDYKEKLKSDLLSKIEENRAQFVEFLKDQHRNNRENFRKNINYIEENIERYDQYFKKVVEKLKEKISKECGKPFSDPCEQLDQFIGSGLEGTVYEIEMEGEKYAVKFCKDIHSTKLDFHAMRIAKEKDIDNVPHLQAYSIEDNVVIMELISGKSIDKHFDEKEGMVKVEKGELSELISTIVDLVESGLLVDPGVENIMYSKQEGMSILDLKSCEGGWKSEDLLFELLYELSLHLGTVVEMEKDVEVEIAEIWNEKFSDKYKKIEAEDLR